MSIYTDDMRLTVATNMRDGDGRTCYGFGGATAINWRAVHAAALDPCR